MTAYPIGMIKAKKPLYFKRVTDKMFGIKERKLWKSKAWDCQVMYEKGGFGHSLRVIDKDGKIGTPNYYETKEDCLKAMLYNKNKPK